MNVFNKLKMGVAAIALSSASLSFAGNPACPEGHCSHVNATIKKFCDDNGLKGQFPVIKDGTICDCPCSCVIGDTQILLNTKFESTPIKNLQVGDNVAVVGERMGTSKVTRFMGDISPVTHKVVRLQTDSKHELAVSNNHTFVKPSKVLVQAEQLSVGDEILDVNGKPVKVINLTSNDMTAQLFNLVVNEGSDNPSDHIIGTQGLMSGDYMLQATQDSLQSAINVRTGKVQPLSINNK